MTTIDIKIRADLLGKTLENMSKQMEQDINQAVDDLATAAYSEAIRLAQARLVGSQADYIKGLTFEKIGKDLYVISLHGDGPNALEEGFASFDMKPGLLSGPKAKVTAKGTRFNTVPFVHQPYSQTPASAAVKDMRDAVQKLIKDRKLNKTVRDATGKPRQGIVATLHNTGIKDLEGLVKIQKGYGKTTQSTYMTFRRVSSNSDPTAWIHPGYKGAHIFPEVVRYVERELDNILKAIL